MVLVDTSVWIEYLRLNPLFEAQMDSLLRSGEVATAGMVLTELRQGCRTRDQARLMLEQLDAVSYLEVERSDWLNAGQMLADARARGYQLGVGDCLLAALALRENCSILTLDQDFKRITGLKLYPIRTM